MGIAFRRVSDAFSNVPYLHQRTSILFAYMSDDELIWRAFRLEAWGPSPERARELFELGDLILQRPFADTLLPEFQKARSEGTQAFRLAHDLSSKFRDTGEDAAREWLALQKGSVSSRIFRHLNVQFEKVEAYWRAQNERRNQPDASSRVRTSLIDGQHHPNALRRLAPATHWNVYIDETGSVFDDTALAFTEPHRVGRIVALVVPAGGGLTPIRGFHAADSSPEAVDQVVQCVLDASVGILGFSVKDQTARHRYWIGHVLHLIRWTLLQLPVPDDGQRCRVEISVEQRDSYGTDTDLSVVARALESEISVLDPERFAQLQLELKFMAKDHPMDGYVDAVAFTWGSTSRASEARLRKSKLLGHCLIEADAIGLHHLYLALSRGGELPPSDWYALCSAVVSDPEGGFLSRELDRLGTTMLERPGQWESYLGEVQFRLQSKQYDLLELGRAIAWLQTHAGDDQTLPGVLKLQLDSSNLALANHRGQIDTKLVVASLDGILKLHDEAPHMACEALLRLVSATTNSFEFHVLEEKIADWLAEPVAVAGLLNYGKLQSARGQLLAFQGAPDQALPWFDKALASFERLSDPAQARREVRQTQAYGLIAFMDALQLPNLPDRESKVSGFFDALSHHFSDQKLSEISLSMVRGSHHDRFDHHLWLRAMTYFPTELAEARKVYLQENRKWQNGRDHPWGLIGAYRAWLFCDAGDTKQARWHLQKAVETCRDEVHGPTLHWMAEVFHSLARSLGIDIPHDPIGNDSRDVLRSRLPHAPYAALALFAQETLHAQTRRDRILAHLEACLPFNFH